MSLPVVHRVLEDVWYGRHPAAVALRPLGWCWQAVATLRRQVYRSGLLGSYQAPVPVIVVGNLSIGGTGKTPLVIWLTGYLKSVGFKPGVVSRGYGGRASKWPQQVRPDSDPAAVGDEPLVIARRTRCPVAVSPDRAVGVAALVEHGDCDIVISDDGLQHYGLGRDIEVAVVDGVRRFGNGQCLPAGPLREPVSRLRDCDLVVTSGVPGRGEFAMKYVPLHAVNIARRDRARSFEELAEEPVHAVAGIGHPERFFAMLRSKGLRVTPHPFPDHHRFQPADLDFGDDRAILMTEKDAVKCEAFATSRCWSIPITAELPEIFATRLDMLLKRGTNGQTIA